MTNKSHFKSRPLNIPNWLGVTVLLQPLTLSEACIKQLKKLFDQNRQIISAKATPKKFITTLSKEILKANPNYCIHR